ncbi:MAG: hypothetical protein KFB97_07965 [Cyanobium sp. M30B3]|nr:MAG: hypothetical protein KFB97_07965 [Cyanobium sp. M30B3]
MVTATITEGDLATLANLTGTGNAYTITLSDATAAASALNTLDGKTTVAVNANSVTLLTGSVADVNAAYSANNAGTISGLGDETVSITNPEGTLLATELSTAGAATSGTVTVTNSQTVTGTVAEVTAALVTDSTKVVMGTASTATISDAATAAEGAPIASTANITASFTSGISDTLVNLASDGTISANLSSITADQNNVVITITDVAGGTVQAADLSAVGTATTGTVSVTNSQTVNGTADQVVAAVVTPASKVDLNSASTLNASNYSTQDLSGVDAAFTLNVTTIEGAVLNAAKLATVDSITIGFGTATIDASTTDEEALAAKTTVNDGTTLTINNYVDTNISGLSNQGNGSIVVNTTTGAVLDEAKLADATSVVLGAAATGAASAIDGIGTNGNRINLNNQTLSVSAYTTENLSGITSAGTLNVTTIDGAVLDAAKLATVDSVTLFGVNTATAADADSLGSRLSGTATLNITTDTITVTTDLSDLGSSLTLQFGGDNAAVVNGATLSVRQDQVNGYTISGTGTVNAKGSASADTFDASGISATLNLSSFAGDDSITVNPADLSSADVIDGGEGTDTLIFSAPTTSVVDGAFTKVSSVEILQLADGTNTISLGAEAEQAGITTVTGGTGNDTLNLLYGSTGVTFNAGDGFDTLSYSTDSSSQAISLSAINAGTASGTVSNDSTDSFSGLEAIVGGSGTDDSITSTKAGEALIITGENAGSIDGFSFSGVESVNLSGGDDTATITGGGSVASLVGGDGTDTLNLDGANNSITITGTGAGTTAGTAGDTTTFSGFETVNSLGGDDAFIVNSASSTTITLAGGEGSDSLSVAASDTTANSLTISGSGSGTLGTVAFSGMETINLGSGGDTAMINTGGSLSGNLNFGAGNDTLDYGGYAGAVTVSLNGATSTAAGGATGISGTVTSFENLIGGSSGNNTLNANAGANTLIVTDGGGLTLDGSLTLFGFETINLGSGSDTVTFAANAEFSGTIDGGIGDSDVLNFNDQANEVTFTSPGSGTWGSTTFSNFEVVNLLGGNDSLTIEGTGSFTSVDGGAGADILILDRNTSNDVVTVTSVGAGSISSGGTSIGSFTNFESIDLISGDTLSYASYGSAVSLTLDSITIGTGTTTTGGATGFSGTISGFETVVGSKNSDTLIASAAANTLILTGANQGTVDGLNFSSFENIDLGAGNDTLSYADYTDPVTVSLNGATSTAAGDATGISGTVTSFETLIGGSGDGDTLNAQAGANTLIVAANGTATLDSSLTVSGFETINLGDGDDTATINDGGSVASLVGGDGNDTLNLDGANNSITITGTGAGTTAGTSGGTTTFSGFETVNSLGGDDAFIVNSASSTTITLAGGEGTDSLSVAASDSKANSLTISGVGSGTLGTVAFSGIETINLGSGDDTATVSMGGSLSGELNLGNGTNTLSFDTDAGAIGSVTAGTGSDTVSISGGSVGGAVNLGDGSNALTISNKSSSIGSYTGGSGNDSITLSGGSISGTVDLGDGANTLLISSSNSRIEGAVAFGSGTSDTLSFAGYTKPVTVSLDSATSTAAGGVASGGTSIITGAVSGFENLVGGSGSDTLNATSGVNTLSVANGGVTTLDGSLTVSGFETINLGAGDDTATINNGGSVASLVGGDGNDTLNLDGAANSITITGTGAGTTAGTSGGTTTFSGFETVNGLGGDDAFIVNSASSTTITLAGGEGTDSLSVAASDNTANSLTISGSGSGMLGTVAFSGMETINLGDGDDTATITNGGLLSGNLNFGDGNDTLSYASYTDAVTVSLNSATSTAAGDATGISGTVTSFETLIGGSGDGDTLNAQAGANTLIVAADGSITLDGSLTVSGFETINLGSGSDIVTLASMFFGTIDGGDGDSDVLNLNASANDVIFTSPGSGTWGSTTFSNFEVVNLLGGDDSLTISGTGSFTSVDGGDDADELILALTTPDDVVTVTSAGAGSISSGGTSIGSFTNFESIDLGSGSDTLNYADYGSAVSLTLDSITNGTGTTTTGGATGFSGTISGFETVVGSGSSDILIASATDNTLILTGANQGTVDGLNFSSFENIDLGAGNDTVQFTSGDSLSGTLAGGDGIDTLDYSAYGSAVVVNLATGTATATGGISGFETVLGSSGDDTITASTSGDVNLQGNGGDDTFNVTVAGLTSGDTIDGGEGSDRIVFTDAGTINDDQFTNVSSVETVTLTGASTINLGSEANEAGIATVTTGTGATTVNSTSANYDLTVNATSLGDSNSLTLTGSDNTNDFTVTGLNGSVLASGTSGTLTINTVDAGDNAIGVTTGSGNTTINASGTNDIVTVNADAMADNTTLDINGSAVFTVTNLEADTDAAGSTGTVNLAYVDVSDNAASITTGSGATTVSGTTSGDTLTIDATSLAQNTTLTASGDAQQVVTNLVGDISATALSGTLTVTTADAADNGISITTGTNNTTITASGAGDIITVNADAMADNTSLAINGSASFSVSNLEADTDAAGSTGVVSLAYTDVSDNAALITTGSGATTVSGSSSGDTLTIDATLLANDITLTLQGEAAMVVTGLSGDLNANSPFSYIDDFSSLDGWTGGKLDSSSAYYGSFLGRYANGAKTNGQDTFKSFSLAGQPATISFDVHRIDSWDWEQFRAYVNDTVAFETTFHQRVDINAVSSSTNGYSWTITPKDQRGSHGFGVGFPKARWDDQTATVTITVPSGRDTIKLGFGSGLDQDIHDESYGIDNLKITTAVSLVPLDGTLVVTTADNTVDNDISITTGTNSTTITANGANDTITVVADALLNNITLTQIGSADQVVTGLVGDINATALTGTLTVTTADATDNGISITAGTNNTTISASGADDIVTVDAEQMADDTTLDINGSATFTITNLEANSDAAGSSGALSITYSNITDNEATLLSGSGNVVVDGGDKSDTVTVTGLSTNNQTFNAQDATSNFIITAGAGNQTITGSNTGNDSIDGGSGYDTLSYAGGNTIDLTITAFDTQAGSSTGQGTDTFSNIENLIGSAGTDVLRGIEAENDEIVTVNAANAGTFADVANTGSFDFSSFEQIDLNAGNDVLAITGNGSLSGSADGGAGTDRLDYSAYTAGPVTVDLNAGTATAIAGGLIGTAGDSSFEDVYGSDYSDIITGDDTANVIRGYGGNDTIFALGGDDTIDGGDGDDVIIAGDGADLILGSAGNDFISGGGYTSIDGIYAAVADQSSDTLSYFGRNEGLDLSLTGTDEGTVKADAGSSLTVTTLTNTYNSAIGQQLITVPTNQVTGTDWTDVYGDIQNLVLTNQNDIVRFDVTDVSTGSIDAAGGSLDTLDYSSFGADSPVLVNLSSRAYSFDFDNNGFIDTTIGEITIVNRNSATNVMVSEASSQGGEDGVFSFEVVIGGAGDDAIVGNDAGNLLVGNAGNDRIAGGSGNDIIYGGDGDDYIIPGAGADRVIPGSGLNTIVVTSSDLAEDTFIPDPNGINTFVLQGDGGDQTSTITAPSGPWNPGARGIALLDGGVPVIDSNGVTTYDTIQGSDGDDNYEFGGTALKNISVIDLGDGDDSVGTAASTKGIKVLYDGGEGTDSITLNFTFDQFARLNAAGLYVADVQNFLDNPTGETFSSSQAGFTAQNFEAGGVSVITPAVYNALQGDPAALTFNSALGVRDSTISSGDDVTLTASALTSSTATALSAADIVSAFVQASGVKGSDAISIASGGSITGSSTAAQDAVALSRTVDDRADSVLSAYGIGTDRSSFTAGDDISLSLSGSVNADTTAEAAAFVAKAIGTVEVAGSRDSSLAAADALDLTITASGLQTVAATNVEGLAIAGLASRAYGIDDANLTNSTSDSVQAGSDLNLQAAASSNNRVTAQTANNEALGTITLIDNGPAATDRFTTSQTGASFPLINGDRVRFTSSNASVQADRDYYVINAIGNLGEFQLSSEPDGSPVDVVAGASLQAYRPAVATADAISTVTGVGLTRAGPGQGGVQAGDALSLQATATDVITATATSVAGDATAGVFRLGGMDGLNLASEVSSVQALVDTVSLAGRGASLNLDATDTATLSAASTEGAALSEANIQVFASKGSDSTAGDDLSLSANAELNLSGSASSTAGSAEARSGAGAGAGVAIPLAVGSGSNVVPTASSFSVVTGLADGTQTAGTDLAVQARGATTLNATASTVSGAGTLGSLWTSATGNILATFDLNLDTTTNTPSFVGPQVLAAGQLVQLDAASAAATGLAPDTDYAVKLLGFGAVDASDAGATPNSITMPTGITYATNDAVRFRLNSTSAPNSGDSRYGLALGTTYYVVNPTATTFQLSASPGGAVIDLIPDNLGAADQLVDADRFQLLTLPTAPGGTYSVATLNPGVAGTPPSVSLTLPSVANAFAGSREADRTLNSSDNLNLAQVSGISGNGGLRGLIAGAQGAISAMASGVLNAMARNTAGDATASAGLVAEGLSDTAISAGSTGSVNAEASITAVADAATTGTNALVDNALADLTITARGLSASNAANAISIGGDGYVQSTANLNGRSTASTVLGDSDALAVLEATGLEALDDGFTATIGQQGAIRAAASIGSLAAPLIINALSSAEGDATAQAAATGVGILGSYDANAPAGFSSLQAGTSQGDISGTASSDLQLRATATDGAASVLLADVPGAGRASITGIENMALTAGAGLSGVDATATGRASLLAQSVVSDASSQGNTSATGLFSSAGDALPVTFADNGRIAAIAEQSSFAQSISVNGNASSSLNNTSLGIGNATITISGDGSLDARAVSQLDSRSQSVAGSASA